MLRPHLFGLFGHGRGRLHDLHTKYCEKRKRFKTVGVCRHLPVNSRLSYTEVMLRIMLLSLTVVIVTAVCISDAAHAAAGGVPLTEKGFTIFSASNPASNDGGLSYTGAFIVIAVIASALAVYAYVPNKMKQYTKKTRRLILSLAIILPLLLLWEIKVSRNVEFYISWAICGEKPVATHHGYKSHSYYEESSSRPQLIRTDMYCTPLEAERAGYSASKSSYDRPNLRAESE